MAHNMEDCPYRNKIEELDDKTSNNEYRIGMLESGDWYSNKELHQMIENVEKELSKFNQQFKKYNGLLEKYEKHEERIKELEKNKNEKETEEETKKEVTTSWREWLGWIVAFLVGILKLAEVLG